VTARLFWAAAAAALLLAVPAAASGIAFTGVAAGDMSETDAILWTRTADAASGEPASAALTAELSAEPDFRTTLFRYTGASDSARAGIAKIDATGLAGHTRYFYRFVAADGTASPTGRFTTAPLPDDPASVRFAFSGDAHGAWRPYPLMSRFGELGLDFFVFLGDTIYETGSTGSPPAFDPFRDPARALTDYRRKYLENIRPVGAGSAAGLEAMFAAQGNYTLLDNHELGNAQFVSGGAPPGDPPGAGASPSYEPNDVNGSCNFINHTSGFAALMQAYLDFQPVRERRVSAAGDCRSDGTWRLYFAQRWGRNAVFVNVDDRSYRDIQIADTGSRTDNPGRTMLGKTQLDWLEGVLAEAQRRGVLWKIVAISSPIDQAGRFGPSDGPKSWIGGYRAERNGLLKFIADNRIEHVVFLTTDDHFNRVQELRYLADPGDQNSWQPVPGAFTIVAGPIGAVGPDQQKGHEFATVKAASDKLAAQQRTAGIAPIGLRPGFPGLKAVFREGDPDADRLRQPVDFYSSDTFNYVTLDIAADGRSLAVETWGTDSYEPNRFPEPSEVAAPRRILGFSVEAN